MPVAPTDFLCILQFIYFYFVYFIPLHGVYSVVFSVVCCSFFSFSFLSFVYIWFDNIFTAQYTHAVALKSVQWALKAKISFDEIHTTNSLNDFKIQYKYIVTLMAVHGFTFFLSDWLIYISIPIPLLSFYLSLSLSRSLCHCMWHFAMCETGNLYNTIIAHFVLPKRKRGHTNDPK